MLPPCYIVSIGLHCNIRRKRMRLALLYKSINGLLALKIPNYFTRFPQTQEFIIINPTILHISEQMPT